MEFTQTNLQSLQKILYRLSDLTASYHAFGIGTLSIKNADIPEDILALACIEPDDFTERKIMSSSLKKR